MFEKMRKVFLTCGPPNEGTIKIVDELYEYLNKNEFQVTADYRETKLMKTNKNAWINDNFNEGYVVLCINKNYLEYACRYRSTDVTDDQDRSYKESIFDRLQSEIIHNGSKNKRFIPVLIEGATHDHLPTVLQTTSAYSWPRDKNKLLNRLLQKQEYKSPQQGSKPKAVIKSVLAPPRTPNR